MSSNSPKTIDNKLLHPQDYAPDHYFNGDGLLNTGNGPESEPKLSFQSCEDNACIVESGESLDDDSK